MLENARKACKSFDLNFLGGDLMKVPVQMSVKYFVDILLKITV